MSKVRQPVTTAALLLFTAIMLATGGCTTSFSSDADLTITNALVYPGPYAQPLERTNISISNGLITDIYSGEPRSSKQTIDAKGRVVTAGLWNSHVHLTDPRLAETSEAILREMFLRQGFTTVIDTGSDLGSTLALKRRIEAGELLGPRIITANGSFVYTDGTPSYLPGLQLPEVERPEQAEPMVAEILNAGSDGVKIFSGSFQAYRNTVHLPPDIIRAISDAAHARDSFVFAHPTDRPGVVNAVENGVDVLAHSAPQAGIFGPDLVERMRANNIALIPTLTLFRLELERAGVSSNQAREYQSVGVQQVSEYFSAGGEILFGTDAGFIDEFDSSEELQLMGAAGMTQSDVLASMTTVPATRFLAESGRLEEGARADIVIYERSPFSDVTNLSRVAYTISAGRVVYSAQ